MCVYIYIVYTYVYIYTYIYKSYPFPPICEYTEASINPTYLFRDILMQPKRMVEFPDDVAVAGPLSELIQFQLPFGL